MAKTKEPDTTEAWILIAGHWSNYFVIRKVRLVGHTEKTLTYREHGLNTRRNKDSACILFSSEDMAIAAMREHTAMKIDRLRAKILDLEQYAKNPTIEVVDDQPRHYGNDIKLR